MLRKEKNNQYEGDAAHTHTHTHLSPPFSPRESNTNGKKKQQGSIQLITNLIIQLGKAFLVLLQLGTRWDAVDLALNAIDFLVLGGGNVAQRVESLGIAGNRLLQS